ncbi:MAG TPA: tripartite tricarboxylate transporter substrate-binding protein [Alphaproteobacteria bacterium]|nr:tripartite tricarboxylate transporter substrate-binding protein [Alphaproteobacteria bacterium]
MKRFLAAALIVLTASAAHAAGVEDFYKGRTISLIIGYSVGGGYDLYGRQVARYLGKHIPGNPTVVPQNMPGAGSLKSVMYLYAAAPKDGTAIGTFGRTEAVAPLLTPDEAKFDATQLGWLGSVTSETSTCVTWHTSKVKTWDDALKTQFTLAGEGAGADPDVFARLIKNVFGAKVKLVSGYPGTNDQSLAMERGEVDGECGLSWGTLESRHQDWLKADSVNIIVQAALKKEPKLPNVPFIMDLAKTPEQQQVLKVVLSGQSMARPFAAPPGLPAERLAALRKAFDDTMKDPDFLDETRKARMEVNPITGAELQALLRDVYATPKDVIAKATHAISD